MRFFWIFVLFPILCFAQPINEKYSNKSFPYHGLSFKDRPASEFNNTIIRGSCFYQEGEPNQDIFPDGMTGVYFTGCNLNNIYVDETQNTIDKTSINRCLTRKIKVQNDWDDWILDDQLKPIEPMDKEQRLKKGISIDPKDIPIKKFTEEERDAFENLFNISP